MANLTEILRAVPVAHFIISVTKYSSPLEKFIIHVYNQCSKGGGETGMERYENDVGCALVFSDRFSDITPYDAGTQRCPPLHFYGPAVRSYWLLHYVVSGKGVFVKNGETYRIREGQCFVIKPYETTFYQADEYEPWRYVWMGFRTSVPLPERFTGQAVIAGHTVTEVFGKLLPLCEEGMQEPDMAVAALIWELLASFCRGDKPREIKSGEQYAAIAKNLIEREYMKGITVTELAARLHLDRSYFSAVFRKYVGIPPQKYINEMRLAAAAELLSVGDYPVSLVARSSGYADVCNFSKMFKERYGVSPKGYSESIKSGSAAGGKHEKTQRKNQ